MMGRMTDHVLDPERCYRAAQSRDARFDGWFYMAVRTTGIYCRPSCPALTPKRTNVEFFRSAAAAQQRGFRACKRCRPDASRARCGSSPTASSTARA
jgi:AraC family transcriptional regulator, regulatory protein of adaptative response / DNA-3-methyladenine glycosylase II